MIPIEGPDNAYSTAHPHEPAIPPALNPEGRCLVCSLAVRADRAEILVGGLLRALQSVEHDLGRHIGRSGPIDHARVTVREALAAACPDADAGTAVSIHSQRREEGIIATLADVLATGEPWVIAQNGRDVAVVLRWEEYQTMLGLAEEGERWL